MKTDTTTGVITYNVGDKVTVTLYECPECKQVKIERAYEQVDKEEVE